jgi:hypothetical protein
MSVSTSQEYVASIVMVGDYFKQEMNMKQATSKCNLLLHVIWIAVHMICKGYKLYASIRRQY